MSEEKDKHTDIEKLFDAKTNTFFNTNLDILKADSTSPRFIPNNVSPTRIILSSNTTHSIDQKHLTTNEKSHLDFFNGTFGEKITAAISEAGGVVTLTVGQSGGGDLTGRFVSGFGTLPDNSTIALTLGTDTSPQVNYIYVLETDPTALVKSTSDWPWTVDHIKVTKIFCPSAVFVGANGVYSFHLWNDEDDDTIFQGHQPHMSDRLRALGAGWDTGVAGNGTQGYLTPTAANVELKSTAGVVYQMHRHDIPAFDTSGTDIVLVKNWSGTAYHDITNLYDIVADSGGNAIGATKWFKMVIWGVANLGGSSFHPMVINLPSSFYNTQAACENDANDTIDTVIPDEFRGTGYLIASIVIQRAATWVIGSTKDLRGQTAATIGGGGSRYTDAEAIAAYQSDLLDEDDMATDSATQGATQQSIKAYADSLDIVEGVTTFVHKVPSHQSFKFSSTSPIVNVAEHGVFTKASTTSCGFHFIPPDWLLRYASTKSKTITCTQIIVNWDNTVNADYISQCRIWFSEGDAATQPNKYSSGAITLGQGSTGFRNDTFDITDTAIGDGDFFYLLFNTIQGTDYANRYKSFDVTYTIA